MQRLSESARVAWQACGRPGNTAQVICLLAPCSTLYKDFLLYYVQLKLQGPEKVGRRWSVYLGHGHSCKITAALCSLLLTWKGSCLFPSIAPPCQSETLRAVGKMLGPYRIQMFCPGAGSANAAHDPSG